MTGNCPECGTVMEKIKDWEDDWVFCPKCHHTMKIERSSNLKRKKPKMKNEKLNQATDKSIG